MIKIKGTFDGKPIEIVIDTNYTETTNPTPVPDPVPPPTASQLYGCRGETLGLRLECKEPVVTTMSQFSVKVYEILTVTTTAPSYINARVGAWEDPLRPVSTGEAFQVGKAYWVDLKIASDAAVGKTSAFNLLGTNYELTVWPMVMPANPFPMYSELQFSQVARAHGLADTGDTLTARAALVQKYIDMARSHGIEPIKQYLSVYPNDINQYSTYGASFKQLVLEKALHAPCLFGPAPTLAPSVAFLTQVEAYIKNGTLPAGTWCYAWDEGEGDATATSNALARVKLIKSVAPSLKVLITRRYDAQFAPYVDYFCPVFEFYNGTPTYAEYGSCMAQGSCTNGVQSTPTGTPMMLIDSDRKHQRAYALVAYLLGSQECLYYNMTETLPTAMQAGGQYKFGGNGDGNLFYFDTNGPLCSLRMKYLQRGLQDVQYMKWAKATAPSLVPQLKDAKSWQSIDFEAIRIAIGKALA